jgi:hypothetical protein
MMSYSLNSNKSKGLLASSLVIVSSLILSHLLLSFTAISNIGHNSHSVLAAICNVLNSTTCSPSNSELPQITIETDKKSYRHFDEVEINGTVSKVAEGKSLRMDIYDPKDSAYLSNKHLKPTGDGSFFHKFVISTIDNEGAWTILVTYAGSTAKAKFILE